MKNVSKWTAGAVLAVAAVLLPALPAAAYVKTSVDIDVNGESRNMVVFAPDKAKGKMPLLIVTHGMNQNPEYQYENDRLYELVDDEKFVIAYLRSKGNTWDIGGDADKNFVLQSVEEMKHRYKIDAKRIYWSGFSMGSMLIYHSLPTVQDVFAAFAPTSGIQFAEQPWAQTKKPVRLIHCHSSQDDVFKIEQFHVRDYIVHFKDVNAATEYTVTEDYRPEGSEDTGTKEVWKNPKNGSELVIYMQKGGGHCPTVNNRHEIWDFLKRFKLGK